MSEETWMVSVYAADDDAVPFAGWIIHNRTEAEAEREARADVENDYPNAGDWSLSPIGVGGRESRWPPTEHFATTIEALDVIPRTVCLDRDLIISLLEPLRLAHVYVLKDSHPEELPDDFKPEKWDGHEIAFARKCAERYLLLLDALAAEQKERQG